MKKLMFLFFLFISLNILFSQNINDYLFNKINKQDIKFQKDETAKINRIRHREINKDDYEIVTINDLKNLKEKTDIRINFDNKNDIILHKEKDVKDILGNQSIIFKYDFENYCIITFNDSSITSFFQLGSEVINIEPINKNYSIMTYVDNNKARELVDQNDQPQIHNTYNFIKSLNKRKSILDNKGIILVNVLVAYTPAAASGAGNISTLISQAITQAMQTYDNSDIKVGLNLVYSTQVNYTESGSMQTDLDNFKNTSDGYMDEIHSLRNTYNADVCVLITANGEYAGLAAASPAEYETAFCVVRYDYAVSQISFTHEIGHLQGCLHQKELQPSSSYNHGYFHDDAVPANRWRTIMAVFDPKYGNTDTRIPYWSDGASHGNADCNNKLVLNNGAYDVANLSSPINVGGNVTINTSITQNVILSSNIIVNSGVTLTISSGITVDLNGYTITTSTGTITIQSGAIISGLKAYLKDGNNIKGLYTSVQSACNNTTSSGDILTVDIQNSVTENITVNGTRLTLQGQGVSTTSINGSISISNSGYVVVQNLNCNGLSFYSCEDPYTRNLKINDGYSFYASNSPVVDLTMTVNSNSGTYAILLSGSSGSFTYQSNFSSDYRAIQLSNYTSATIDGTTFCGNTYDIYADGTSSATAGYNIANTYSGNPPSTRFYGNVGWNTNSYSICQQKSVPQNRKENIAIMDPAYDEFVKIRDPYFELTRNVRNDIMITGNFIQSKFSNDYNNAISNFNSFIINNPNSSLAKTALLLAANCYKKQNDYEGMKTYLQNVIGNSKLSNINNMANLLMMDYYNNQNDFTSSLSLADKILQSEKSDTSIICNVLFAQAFIYQSNTGEKEKAISAYLTILNNYPENGLASFAKYQLEGLGVIVEDNKPKNVSTTETKITFTTSNYPNPFNPTTTISYSIPSDGKVVVKVFDVLGRELATLVNESTTAGKHNVLWNGNNFASGIYFYSVTFKNQTLYKKMLLVK